jgi:hypothetical protein
VDRNGSVAYNVSGVGSGEKINRRGRRILEKLGKERRVKRIRRSARNTAKFANTSGRHTSKSPAVTVGIRHNLGNKRNRINLGSNKGVIMINKPFRKIARKVFAGSRASFKVRRIGLKNAGRLISIHGFAKVGKAPVNTFAADKRNVSKLKKSTLAVTSLAIPRRRSSARNGRRATGRSKGVELKAKTLIDGKIGGKTEPGKQNIGGNGASAFQTELLVKMAGNLNAARNAANKVPGSEKFSKSTFRRKVTSLIGAGELKMVPKATTKRLVFIIEAFNIRENDLRKSVKMPLFYVRKKLGSFFFGSTSTKGVAIREIILNVLRNIAGRFGKRIKVAAVKLARAKSNGIPQNLSRI